MTWMYRKQSGELFPTTTNAIESELEDVYHIKNREYDIRNVAESDNLVILELIESYSDPHTAQMYRTLMVLVLEMEHGKIKREDTIVILIFLAELPKMLLTYKH